MKNKKIILILAVLITFFLVISTVNAAENNTKSTNPEIKKHAQTTENTKTAASKTIYVSIYGNDNVGQGTTAKPYRTLAKAVTQTNNNDNIILMPGTHTLTNTNPIQINKNIHIKGQDKNRVAIKSYGSSNDLININKQVTLQISNLQFKQSYNIKSVINNTGKLALNNVNFQQNSITDSWYTKALINNHGTMSLKNTQFSHNIGNKGSAIYNTGSVYMQSSTLKFNKANFGGALYNQKGNIIIKESMINSNQVYPSTNTDWDNEDYVYTGGLGAAIYNNAYMEIHNSAVEWNKITDGVFRVQRGAIYNTGTLVIKKSNLTHNDIYGSGGAIYSTSKLVISDSNINNNKATYCGGAIYSMINADLQRNNLLGNQVTMYGGAVCCSGKMNIKLSKINSNKAGIHGGAIYNTGSLILTSDILNKNNADSDGGGIYSLGSITVKSSDINYNKASSSAAICSRGNLFVNRSTINNNNANYWGGAIYTSGNTNIYSSNIKNNVVKESGGAIYSEGNTNIVSSTLTNNVAKANEDSYGGAIHVMNGTTKVTNSKVNQNTARYGGAIGIWDGKLVLTSTQLNDNYATESGGAISVMTHEDAYSYPIIDINKCTMNENNAKKVQVIDNGVGISGGSYATIKNSILSNNGKKSKDSYEKTILTAKWDLKIYNSKFINNNGRLIQEDWNLIMDSCTITGNKASADLIFVSCVAKVTNTKIKNNGAKCIFEPRCGQGPGELTVSKSVLYNPKAKYEIDNRKSDGVTSNVKCDNNWWGTKSKPTYRVAQCVIRSYYKGLK